MGKYIYAILISIIFSANTYAAKSVFDSRNFAKNIITSKTALKIEAEEVKQRIQQYKQLLIMMKNSEKVDSPSWLKQRDDYHRILYQLSAYKGSLNKVHAALSRGGGFLESLSDNYALAGEGNFNDYLSVLSRRSESGDIQAKSLVNMAVSVQRNLEDSTQRRLELQAQSQEAVGALQSSQTTNQYLDVIVGQNTQLTSLISRKLIDDAQDVKTKSLNTKRTEQVHKKFNRDSESSMNNFNDRWGL